MTKNIRKIFLAGLLATATVMLAPADRAMAQLKPPVIVVVDVNQILQESTATKSIRRQLDSQRDVYQKEIAGQEEKLRSAEQELGRQRQVLSQEAFAQKRKDFEQQVGELQRNVQARKRSLDHASGESHGQVLKAIEQIINDVAKEQGATMVMNRQAVIYLAEKSLDLTGTVLERLNKKLPEVKVTIPKG